MATKKGTPHIAFIADITCPSCKNIIRVMKETKIITPAEKAEKEELYYAEASVQKKL
jgi:hypothetical protein